MHVSAWSCFRSLYPTTHLNLTTTLLTINKQQIRSLRQKRPYWELVPPHTHTLTHTHARAVHTHTDTHKGHRFCQIKYIYKFVCFLTCILSAGIFSLFHGYWLCLCVWRMSINIFMFVICPHSIRLSIGQKVDSSLWMFLVLMSQ